MEQAPSSKNVVESRAESAPVVTLYRIENKSIERIPDGITSLEALKGQWFTPDLDTVITYLRKSQQTFGVGAKDVPGATLVMVRVPAEQLQNLRAANHPIASGMDIESNNYLIAPDQDVPRVEINLDGVERNVARFDNLMKARSQIQALIDTATWSE